QARGQASRRRGDRSGRQADDGRDTHQQGAGCPGSGHRGGHSVGQLCARGDDAAVSSYPSDACPGSYYPGSDASSAAGFGPGDGREADLDGLQGRRRGQPPADPGRGERPDPPARRRRQGTRLNLPEERHLGAGTRHHPRGSRPCQGRARWRHPYRVTGSADEGERGPGPRGSGEAERGDRDAHEAGRGPAEGDGAREQEAGGRRGRGRGAGARSAPRRGDPALLRGSRGRGADPPGDPGHSAGGRDPPDPAAGPGVPAGTGAPLNPGLGRLPEMTSPFPPPVAYPAVQSVSQDVLAKGITVRANKATNSIFIRHYEADLERIKKLVREQLDVPLPQVKIEARMEILDRTSLEAIGVQWGGAAAGNTRNTTLIGQGFQSSDVTRTGTAATLTPVNPNLSLAQLLPIAPPGVGTGLSTGGNLVNLPFGLLPNASTATPAGSS